MHANLFPVTHCTKLSPVPVSTPELSHEDNVPVYTTALEAAPQLATPLQSFSTASQPYKHSACVNDLRRQRESEKTAVKEAIREANMAVPSNLSRSTDLNSATDQAADVAVQPTDALPLFSGHRRLVLGGQLQRLPTTCEGYSAQSHTDFLSSVNALVDTVVTAGGTTSASMSTAAAQTTTSILPRSTSTTSAAQTTSASMCTTAVQTTSASMSTTAVQTTPASMATTAAQTTSASMATTAAQTELQVPSSAIATLMQLRSTPQDNPPPTSHTVNTPALAVPAKVADPIDWILYVPDAEPDRYRNFNSLNQDTRQQLSNKFNAVFHVHTNDSKHDSYVRFVKQSLRKKRTTCVCQFLYKKTAKDCKGESACAESEKYGCPCVRMVQHANVYKLCFYPAKPTDGAVSMDEWQSAEFWLPST